MSMSHMIDRLAKEKEKSEADKLAMEEKITELEGRLEKIEPKEE